MTVLHIDDPNFKKFIVLTESAYGLQVVGFSDDNNSATNIEKLSTKYEKSEIFRQVINELLRLKIYGRLRILCYDSEMPKIIIDGDVKE